MCRALCRHSRQVWYVCCLPHAGHTSEGRRVLPLSLTFWASDLPSPSLNFLTWERKFSHYCVGCPLFLSTSPSIFCPSLPHSVPEEAVFYGQFPLGALAFCLPVGFSQRQALLGDIRWEDRQVRMFRSLLGHSCPGLQGCWLDLILPLYLLTRRPSSMSLSFGQAGLVTPVFPFALSGVATAFCCY